MYQKQVYEVSGEKRKIDQPLDLTLQSLHTSLHCYLPPIFVPAKRLKANKLLAFHRWEKYMELS